MSYKRRGDVGEWRRDCWRRVQQGSGLFSSGKQETVLARARSLISPSFMEPLQSFACRKKQQKNKKNRLKNKIKKPWANSIQGWRWSSVLTLFRLLWEPFRCVFSSFCSSSGSAGAVRSRGGAADTDCPLKMSRLISAGDAAALISWHFSQTWSWRTAGCILSAPPPWPLTSLLAIAGVCGRLFLRATVLQRPSRGDFLQPRRRLCFNVRQCCWV